MDTNCWVIIGRLTRDAEGKTLPSGTFVANFSIANETGWGDRKKTNFWNVRYFGQGAASIIQWLTKGKQVSIVGEGENENWVDHSGVERKNVVITARNIQLLASPAGQGSNAEGARNPSGNHGEFAGSDIPF